MLAHVAEKVEQVQSDKVKASAFDKYIRYDMIVVNKKCVTTPYLDLHWRLKPNADEKVPALIEYLKDHPEIKKVDLGMNPLSYESCQALARVKTVKEWDLSSCDLDFKSVIEFVQHTSANKVDLGGNNIDANCAKQIALLNQNITELGLGTNKLDNLGVLYFMKHNKKVIKLDLSNNQVTSDGAEYIAMHNKVCWSLNLSNNRIGDAGAVSLMQGTVITTLDVSCNGVSHNRGWPLDERIASNRERARVRADWMRYALLTSYMRANRDSAIKDSIFDLIPHIMMIMDERSYFHGALNQKFMGTKFFERRIVPEAPKLPAMKETMLKKSP